MLRANWTLNYVNIQDGELEANNEPLTYLFVYLLLGQHWFTYVYNFRIPMNQLEVSDLVPENEPIPVTAAPPKTSRTPQVDPRSHRAMARLSETKR